MSHFSVSKIKIRNPDQELLQRVVKQISLDMHGLITHSIESMEGQKETNFLIAFQCSQIPKGIGVRLNANGEVELVGDFYLIGPEMKRLIEAELVKNYTALAISRTLGKMGYQVQTKRAMQKVMIVAEH